MSKSQFGKSVLVLASLSIAAPAFANQPMVVCGGSPGNAAVELDNITVARGGNYENELVLRNREIIDDFLSKQAIYGGELSSSGEFIASGTERFEAGHASLAASISNRGLNFRQVGPTSYELEIGYTDSSFHDVTLANFVFNDCQTVKN